jgi:hypothetical protein
MPVAALSVGQRGNLVRYKGKQGLTGVEEGAVGLALQEAVAEEVTVVQVELEPRVRAPAQAATPSGPQTKEMGGLPLRRPTG